MVEATRRLAENNFGSSGKSGPSLIMHDTEWAWSIQLTSESFGLYRQYQDHPCVTMVESFVYGVAFKKANFKEEKNE